jgi:hypothetical protein
MDREDLRCGRGMSRVDAAAVLVMAMVVRGFL